MGEICLDCRATRLLKTSRILFQFPIAIADCLFICTKGQCCILDLAKTLQNPEFKAASAHRRSFFHFHLESRYLSGSLNIDTFHMPLSISDYQMPPLWLFDKPFDNVTLRKPNHLHNDQYSFLLPLVREPFLFY